MNKPSAFAVYTAISGCLGIQFAGDAIASPATNRVLYKEVIVGEKSKALDEAGDIDDFIAELEQDPEVALELANGRKWLASSELSLSLKQLRLQAGISQFELARRVGLKQPNISEMEAGKRTPSVPVLLRLSRALNVSGDTILQAFENQEETHVQ